MMIDKGINLTSADVDEMARKLTDRLMVDIFGVREPGMTSSAAEEEQVTLKDLERIVNELKPKERIDAILLTERNLDKNIIAASYNFREYAIISRSDFYNDVYPRMIREFTEAGNPKGLAEIEIVTDEDLVDQIFASFLWAAGQ